MIHFNLILNPVCWSIELTLWKFNHCSLPHLEALLSKSKQALLLNTKINNDRVWPVVRLPCSAPYSSLLSGHSLSSPGSWSSPQACKTTNTEIQCVIMLLESTKLSQPASKDTVVWSQFSNTFCDMYQGRHIHKYVGFIHLQVKICIFYDCPYLLFVAPL